VGHNINFISLCTGGTLWDLPKNINVVEILCTHVYKWKNETCWNYSRNGRQRRMMAEGVNLTMISELL
jgi:hypothetical protein